jgi:hypothetical protein
MKEKIFKKKKSMRFYLKIDLLFRLCVNIHLETVARQVGTTSI